MDITADDVLAPRSSIEAPERDRAVEWLKEILEGVDSMPSNEISKLAAQEGFKEHTLRNAKKKQVSNPGLNMMMAIKLGIVGCPKQMETNSGCPVYQKC